MALCHSAARLKEVMTLLYMLTCSMSGSPRAVSRHHRAGFHLTERGLGRRGKVGSRCCLLLEKEMSDAKVQLGMAKLAS